MDPRQSLTRRCCLYKHFIPFKLPFTIISVTELGPRLTIVISIHWLKELTKVEAVASLENSYTK